jgi:MFS family permease
MGTEWMPRGDWASRWGIQGSTKNLCARLVQLLAVMAAGSGATFAVATLGPLQESMRAALQLSDNEVSVLQGPILYLPSMVAAVPLGYLIDRFSRASLLSVFAALECLAVVLASRSTGLVGLVVARAVIGLLMSAIAMDASALVGSLVNAAWRGRAFMVLSFAQIAGMSAAFYLGGLLLAHEGDQWRYVMLWMAAPLALVFLFTLIVREPARDRVARESNISIRVTARRAWTIRGVIWPLAFGPVAVSVGYMASLVWASPILIRTAGLHADQVGAIMGTSLMVSALLGPLLGGFISDRIERLAGPRRMVSALIVMALLELPAGLFAIMPSVLLFEILLTLLSTIFFMKGILVTALSIAVFPNELRGLCFGIQNAIMGIFASASPILVSVLSQHSAGPNGMGRALTMVCVATSALGVIAFAFSRGNFPERLVPAG